jgi:hypothetical protein
MQTVSEWQPSGACPTYFFASVREARQGKRGGYR